MPDVIEFRPGGFRYVRGVFQYSAAVAALPGFRIERVRFKDVVPLADGFRRIEETLTAANRPPTAFCACELRSPAPFTEAGFAEFNRRYAETLEQWGLLADKTNPVARSNVCPALAPPSEPGFYAFSYTVPDADGPPTFVVAGSAEVPEGHANYQDHIVARGDVSPDGLRQKARFVLAEMERRMGLLGYSWNDCTVVQVYTVHDMHPFVADEIGHRGTLRSGLTWHFARPPVVGLEYEMDCRGVMTERSVA